MCERCKAIVRAIVSLELLRDTIADPPKLAVIDEAIEDLRSEKAALHDGTSIGADVGAPR